MNQITS